MEFILIEFLILNVKTKPQYNKNSNNGGNPNKNGVNNFTKI